MTETTISGGTTGNGLFKVAAGGLVSGLLTPLAVPVIDQIAGSPGDFRIALVAVPFAVLILIVVRRCVGGPWWTALAAALVTMIAFVCAVNAAIWIDGQLGDANKLMRNIVAGLTGGFTGAAVMAIGIALLPAGPREAAAWLPMLVAGTVAGALLAFDSALDLDLTSVLYPVWQAAVAAGLATALRRTTIG